MPHQVYEKGLAESSLNSCSYVFQLHCFGSSWTECLLKCGINFLLLLFGFWFQLAAILRNNGFNCFQLTRV